MAAFAAVCSSGTKSEWTVQGAVQALKSHDAARVEEMKLSDGKIPYIESLLAGCDQETIEWFEKAFPTEKPDYDRILLIASYNQPTAFLDWLADAKQADFRRVSDRSETIWGALVIKTTLTNMKWIVARGLASLDQRHADHYFSRAVMYESHEDVINILEWLDSLGMKPGSESLQYALTYSVDPYATIIWLTSHGAGFAVGALKYAVQRIYQAQATAVEVETLTVWLRDTYKLGFGEEYCLEILDKSYKDESVPLLAWALRQGVPLGAGVEEWITKESQPKAYEYRPELKEAILKLLRNAKP